MRFVLMMAILAGCVYFGYMFFSRDGNLERIFKPNSELPLNKAAEDTQTEEYKDVTMPENYK